LDGAAQIITHLLKLYDAQRNLIIVVNATPSDEAGLAEDLSNLGVRRPGLVQVGYEMNAKQRLVSVWPRVFMIKERVQNLTASLQQAALRVWRVDLCHQSDPGCGHVE